MRTNDDPAAYRLDTEQCARLRDCLKNARQALTKERLEKLIREVEVSINDFHATTPRGTFRSAHDALRELWLLSQGTDDDRSVAVLRARISALPRAAVEYLDGRIPIVGDSLFPDEGPMTRFQKWAATADPEKLIRVTRAISAGGSEIVEGRSRGVGKRSALRLEPEIMGEVRGAGAVRDRGGRPRNEDQQNLIMDLAFDWLHATGELPKAGRSDKSGFGDLVHSVFQWLDMPNAAAHALRNFWESRKN
jgi:hypothetical protein